MPAPIKWSTADFSVSLSPGVDYRLPSVTATPDGGFILSFTTEESLGDENASFRPYSSAGTVKPTLLTLNTILGVDERFTMGATLADGRHVEVWTEQPNSGGGDLSDVYVQINHFFGETSVDGFLVGGGAGDQKDPAVAASLDGRFAVAYQDFSVAGGQIVVKFYDYRTVGGLPVLANTTPGTFDNGGDMRDVAITALTNGNFVVAWSGADGAVRGQVFNLFGTAIGTEFTCNTATAFDTNPDVTALADGRFVVTWLCSDTAVRGQFFQADGSSGGSAFDIATDAIFAVTNNISTAALKDGRFVTVFIDDAGDVRGQITSAGGVADGVAFLVNSDQTTNKEHPSIDTLADGRFVVSWEDSIAGDEKITSTIFDPREARISQSASFFSDDWYGTAFSDTLFMGVGNDVVHGGGAADFIFGEAGNDILFGEASDDRIEGGTGADAMTGGIGNDFYYVDALGDNTIEVAGEGVDSVRSSISWTLLADVEKLYLTGTAVVGVGNALSNFIYGNASANILNGQGGADRMYGGAADDRYYVDSAGDLVFETIAGAAGGANDEVISYVSHTLSNNVERLTLDDTSNVNATGNALANIITGNTANNFIDGKAGNDTLTGNGGNDQFLFTTALNASTNVDTITDFDAANDFLRLDDAIFTQIAMGFLSATAFAAGASATTAAHRIVYNSVTGDVFYDRDGVGGVAQVKFADIGAGTALTEADIFVF